MRCCNPQARSHAQEGQVQQWLLAAATLCRSSRCDGQQHPDCPFTLARTTEETTSLASMLCMVALWPQRVICPAPNQDLTAVVYWFEMTHAFCLVFHAAAHFTIAPQCDGHGGTCPGHFNVLQPLGMKPLWFISSRTSAGLDRCSDHRMALRS